jgi:hypothetical protein
MGVALPAAPVRAEPSGIVASPARRIVLYPYGTPRDPQLASMCASQVVRCGGDPARTFDAPPANLNRFLEHVRRIPALSQGPGSMLVLTVTDPMALAVVATRRRIEAAIPMLAFSLWAVFVSPEFQDRLLCEVEGYGFLSGPLNTAPTWRSPGDKMFLVLSREVGEEVNLQRRAAACALRASMRA